MNKLNFIYTAAFVQSADNKTETNRNNKINKVYKTF